MKQFLVLLLTIILSAPSFAGGLVAFADKSNSEDTLVSTQEMTGSLHSYRSGPHSSHSTSHSKPQTHSDCHSDKTAPHQQKTAPHQQKTAHHDCCDFEADHGEAHHVASNHAEMDCEEQCADCSHGCGGICFALLPEHSKTLGTQPHEAMTTSVRLPAAPYQNPLIPPIIRA